MENMTDNYGELVNKIKYRLSEYELFYEKRVYFESENFKKLVIKLAESENKSEFKENLSLLADDITSNTAIGFNYDLPIMIWTNWGLDQKRYVGSGGGVGSEFGFGSDTEFDIVNNKVVNLKLLLEQVIYLTLLYYKNQKDKTCVPKIWKDVVDDIAKNYKLMTIYLLGRVWLDKIPSEKLENLQIRTRQNKFIDKSYKKEKPIELDSLEFKLISYYFESCQKKGAKCSVETLLVTPPNSRGREVEQQGVRQ